jgi:hypothetical protein
MQSLCAASMRCFTCTFPDSPLLSVPYTRAMNAPSPQPRIRTLAWLRTPLAVTLLYVGIALVAEDDYYPFSHFPMYSYVSTSRHYMIVTDGDGKPIPVATLTGLTTGMIGKTYRNYVEQEARKLVVRNVDLPPEALQRVAQRVFRQLRDSAQRQKKEMPVKLQLLRADVSFEDGKVMDKTTLVASE